MRSAFEDWWEDSMKLEGQPSLVMALKAVAKDAWDAAIRDAAHQSKELDCTHGCGVGHEVSEHIKKRCLTTSARPA